MRAILSRCLVAAALFGGVLASPTASLARPDGPPAPPPGKPDLVDVTKLPACDVKPWRGFETPEEAAAIPEDAPVCMPPQDAVEIFRPGPKRPVPVPAGDKPLAAGYRWNGVVTEDLYKGIEATIQVTNTSVDHDGSLDEFVVSRVMGKAPVDPGNWVEAGWAESSWEDDSPYVYTYNTVTGAWKGHFQFEIYPSLYYKWRVDRCSVAAATVHTCAYLFWDGSWRLLASADAGCSVYQGSTDNQRCLGEALTETYSRPGSAAAMTPTPSIATGNRVDWDDVRVRQGTSWNRLLSGFPVFISQNSPYVVCFQDYYYDFSVHRYAC